MAIAELYRLFNCVSCSIGIQQKVWKIHPRTLIKWRNWCYHTSIYKTVEKQLRIQIMQKFHKLPPSQFDDYDWELIEKYIIDQTFFNYKIELKVKKHLEELGYTVTKTDGPTDYFCKVDLTAQCGNKLYAIQVKRFTDHTEKVERDLNKLKEWAHKNNYIPTLVTYEKDNIKFKPLE